jgi:hypothetical protein
MNTQKTQIQYPYILILGQINTQKRQIVTKSVCVEIYIYLFIYLFL